MNSYIKIFFLIFFSIFFINVQCQFSVKTEYLYLKQINIQKNKILIKDNIKNAEIVISNITSKIDTPNKFNELFLSELVKSYFLINKNKEAFFYSLYQRCLFPNKPLSRYQENSFKELAYSINLNDSLTLFYWNYSSFKNIHTTNSGRIETLLKLTTNLYLEDLEDKIYRLGLALRSRGVYPTIKYQHWEYLTIINLKEKHKEKILQNDLNNLGPLYKQLEGKYRYKIYKKAINHYIKTKSYRKAYKLITEYEAEDISAYRYINIGFLELKMNIKKMFN